MIHIIKQTLLYALQESHSKRQYFYISSNFVDSYGIHSIHRSIEDELSEQNKDTSFHCPDETICITIGKF